MTEHARGDSRATESGGSAPPTGDARRLYHGEWYSCDGFYDGEVRAMSPEGYWPGMVALELSGAGPECFGATLTVDDARDLANHILAAVDSADLANREAARARRVSGASSPASSSRCT